MTSMARTRRTRRSSRPPTAHGPSRFRFEPGPLRFQFVVDGEQWIGDPFATEQNDDGFGSRNAVLDVRPPAETI